MVGWPCLGQGSAKDKRRTAMGMERELAVVVEERDDERWRAQESGKAV